jgi:NAD+ kinase
MPEFAVAVRGAADAGTETADVEAAVRAAGATVVAGGPGDHGGDGADDDAPNLVVAVGERAVLDLATAPPAAPVLPVGGPVDADAATAGPLWIPRERTERAVAAAVAGDGRPTSHPVFGVGVDGRRVGRAVTDVSLFAAEPARISAFAVGTAGGRLGRVRADGLVVATPLGSPGYARAAGGPVLGPGAGAVVAPVAPFATAPDVWVLSVPPALSLSVERDEGPVELVLDGELRRRVGPDDRVTVRRAADLSVLWLPTVAGVAPAGGPDGKGSNESSSQ